MATKKKSEVEVKVPAESKPAAKKKTTAAKPAVKKTAAATEAKKTAKPKSAAATHKAPARRTKTAKAAAFDVDLHRAEIEHEAYLIWAGRGHEHGQAHEDWLRAIEIVKARQQG